MKKVIIRTDANSKLGSGHVIRCLSISEEFIRFGYETVFVVSDEEAECFVEKRGGLTFIISGDPSRFTFEDGANLAHFANEIEAEIILVDSYAVTDGFFDGIASTRTFNKIAYIDDLYTFEYGHLPEPHLWPVDFLIDYLFHADLDLYEKGYASANTELLIGLAFTPIRSHFAHCSGKSSYNGENILVTTGSMNPCNLLERIVDACLELPSCKAINVVIGSQASFALSSNDRRIRVLQGIDDLAPYMQKADLVISAAGTTLYELSAVGVPTFAIAMVDNQMKNADSFQKLGLGRSIGQSNFASNELAALFDSYIRDPQEQKANVETMRKLVDGKGAARIASVLTESKNLASKTGLRDSNTDFCVLNI